MKLFSIYTNLQKAKISKEGESLLFDLRSGPRNHYPAHLRAFSLTLHYYSRKGYEYVRNAFDKSLPCARTMRKWYSNIKGEPGITTEILDHLKQIVTNRNEPLYVNLEMDEMSIKCGAEFVQSSGGGHTTGYVSFGSDSSKLAKNALVYMVSGLNEKLLAPVAYFFVGKLNKTEKAVLTAEVIRCVTETGAKISTLTFDGDPVNFSMCTELGADFENGKEYIINNYDPEKTKIYIMPDACHMLKLIRNAIEAYGKIYNEQGEVGDWVYYKRLAKYQEGSVTPIAKNFTTSHVEFKDQIMSVSLATQLLSKKENLNMENCYPLSSFEHDGSDHKINFITRVVVEFIKMFSNKKLKIKKTR